MQALPWSILSLIPLIASLSYSFLENISSSMHRNLVIFTRLAPLQLHWVKKRISLVRKQHGNHLETPGYHRVSLVFHSGNSKFHLVSQKGNAVRSGFGDSLAWKPGGNLGHMETRANLYGNHSKRNMSVTTRKLGFPT